MKFLKVVLIVVGLIKAQTSFAQLKTELGVKAGFNYTNLDLSTVGRLGAINNYHWNPTFHVGVYGMIRLPKKSKLYPLALQPEIVFSKQGQKFTTPYNSDLQTLFYYVNVPVIIKYYFLNGVNLQFGPQIGIMAGSKGDLLRIQSSGLNRGNIVGQALENQSLKQYINTTDFSLVFGTGFDFPFGGNLTIRYNVGISDVNKFTNDPANQIKDGNGNTITPSISTAYARNQALQISFGYRLKKKGK